MEPAVYPVTLTGTRPSWPPLDTSITALDGTLPPERSLPCLCEEVSHPLIQLGFKTITLVTGVKILCRSTEVEMIWQLQDWGGDDRIWVRVAAVYMGDVGRFWICSDLNFLPIEYTLLDRIWMQSQRKKFKITPRHCLWAYSRMMLLPTERRKTMSALEFQVKVWITFGTCTGNS